MVNFEKFYAMTPMKYYDCGGDFTKPKAIAMLTNEGKNYIATKKNDGEWCRIIKDANGNIKAQSRSISKVTGEYGDKTEHIPHIINEMRSYPCETVLIGELCFEDITKTSKDVGSILRCKPDKAVARQKSEPLVFKVFDCLAFAGIDLTDKPYWERFANANDAIGDYRHYITITDYIEFGDFEEFLQEKSDFLMLMHYNKWLRENAPKFHTEAYFNQMKRRLYTKDKAFYEGFKHLGESFINWYYVDGEWLYYKDGKKVKNEK